MKKIFYALLLMLTIASCTSDRIDSQENLTEFSQRENDTFYREAFYHRDGDLVLPIQLEGEDITFYKVNVADDRDVTNLEDGQLYADPECTIQSADYTYCGGGVYTNGNPSENYTVTYYEFAWGIVNAPWPYTVVVDDFSGHIYAYTTRWGGTCL